jgi:hypothetical protein
MGASASSTATNAMSTPSPPVVSRRQVASITSSGMLAA